MPTDLEKLFLPTFDKVGRRLFRKQGTSSSLVVEIELPSHAAVSQGYGCEFRIYSRWPAYLAAINSVEEALVGYKFPYKLSKFKVRRDGIFSAQHQFDEEANSVVLSDLVVPANRYISDLAKLLETGSLCNYLYQKGYCRGLQIVEPPFFFLFSCRDAEQSIDDTLKLFQSCKQRGWFSNWRANLTDKTKSIELQAEHVDWYFSLIR